MAVAPPLHEDDVETDVSAGSDRRPSALAIVVLIIATAFAAVAGTSWWDHRPEKVGAVDVGFFDDMTTHHSQAIAMATLYQRVGDDPVLESIAAEIVFAQAGDIRQMQYALGSWHRHDDPNVAMKWMNMPVPQTAQPGMITPAQFETLGRARGRHLDDLWSALMINHHSGGIHMADYVVTHGKTALARRMATIMARNQRYEIIDLNFQRKRLGLPEHAAGQPVEVTAT